MRFFEIIAAWIGATVIAYVLCAVFSQSIVLRGLMELGLEIPLMDRLGSVAHAVVNMNALAVVIGLGFVVAFYIASIFKAALPALRPLAYPLAGAATVATALYAMKAMFGMFPILGAQETLGFWLQIAAGAMGGIAFEVMRPNGVIDRMADR